MHACGCCWVGPCRTKPIRALVGYRSKWWRTHCSITDTRGRRQLVCSSPDVQNRIKTAQRHCEVAISPLSDITVLTTKLRRLCSVTMPTSRIIFLFVVGLCVLASASQDQPNGRPMFHCSFMLKVNLTYNENYMHCYNVARHF